VDAGGRWRAPRLCPFDPSQDVLSGLGAILNVASPTRRSAVCSPRSHRSSVQLESRPATGKIVDALDVAIEAADPLRNARNNCAAGSRTSLGALLRNQPHPSIGP
jgi:hypothetical protein